MPRSTPPVPACVSRMRGVPLAKSATARRSSAQAAPASRNQAGTQITTGQFGVQIQQAIFDGFQTQSNVRAAEARVRASSESLRNTEQNVLFNAVSAFMDVIRDRRAWLASAQRNLEFLAEQVRSADSRFEVGEGTRKPTSRRRRPADRRPRRSSARRAPRCRCWKRPTASWWARIPASCKAASPAASPLPPSMEDAFVIAMRQHPAIMATQHLVDVAGFAVNAAEGAAFAAGLGTGERAVAAALRSVGDRPARRRQYHHDDQYGDDRSQPDGADLFGRALLGAGPPVEGIARPGVGIEVDVTRDDVRHAVALRLDAVMGSPRAEGGCRQPPAVSAAVPGAFPGVTEERNVGQRTTLDVLNAQGRWFIKTPRSNLAQLSEA